MWVIMAHPGRRLRASVIWTILCQAKRFAITDDTLSIRMYIGAELLLQFYVDSAGVERIGDDAHQQH